MLAWARTDVFAFVIYYKQPTGVGDEEDAQAWTRALIDAALGCGGTYYLPYRLHATRDQFVAATSVSVLIPWREVRRAAA